MAYFVYYNNHVDNNLVEVFETFQEAFDFCVVFTNGFCAVCDGDSCSDGTSRIFHYDIYLGPAIDVSFDEQGNVVEDQVILKEPIYSTPYYYSL